MTKEKIISPRFSFEGWQFKEWVKGNWKTIKEIIKVGLPLLLSIKIFENNPALIALVTLAGKLALDSLQYYIKEKTEEL